MNILTAASAKLKFHPPSNMSAAEAANFRHLYWDIAWFGLAFGSTMSFLPVFATRLGATGWQVGLLTALPALASVFLTLPAARWVEGRPLGRVLKQTVLLQRAGFVLLIPLPFVFSAGWQILAVLLLTMFMAIPGTALVIGFNAMLATTVASEYRGMVVGRRNALLAGAVMVSFLLCGTILERLSFEWGYFVVFGLGAIGSAASAYHLISVKIPEASRQFAGHSLGDAAQAGRLSALSVSAPQRLTMGLRMLMQWRPQIGSFKNISAPFWWAMLAYFIFHFAQLMPGPLFPIFWVREAQLTDGQIGWVNAVFFLAMLVIAPLLAPLGKRLGNRRLNVAGAILLGLHPLLTALSHGMPLLIVASLWGGATWAILSGALYNRLLEIVPVNSRPMHLAVYNLSLSVAMLSGTMLGPLMADAVGLREILYVAAALRFASGFALARWG